MRPVVEQFPVTQGFGSLATRGVQGDPDGSQVQVLVALYGDYQPDGHNGTDIGCPVGTPVYAARAGTVVVCDWDVNLPGDDSWSASGYFQRFAFFKRFGGRLLVVKVAENDYDVYAHLSEWKAGYGQQVSEGQLVALSGDSSAGQDGQLGPHLHTERIVDLTYSTGNGLIFGRMDPTSVWGQGIAAMSGDITPLTEPEDDDMPAFSDYTIHDKDGNENSPEQVWNSIDRKLSFLLEGNVEDPAEPGKFYSPLAYIVGGATNSRVAAAAASLAAGQTAPDSIAAAAAKGAASVNAAAIAGQLNITVKSGN